jgi:hypothetical protein
MRKRPLSQLISSLGQGSPGGTTGGNGSYTGLRVNSNLSDLIIINKMKAIFLLSTALILHEATATYEPTFSPLLKVPGFFALTYAFNHSLTYDLFSNSGLDRSHYLPSLPAH